MHFFKFMLPDAARKKFSFIAAEKKSREEPNAKSSFAKVNDEQKCYNSTGKTEETTVENLKQTEDHQLPPPNDRYGFTYIFFVYLGLTGTINSYYVFSANDVSINCSSMFILYLVTKWSIMPIRINIFR